MGFVSHTELPTVIQGSRFEIMWIISLLPGNNFLKPLGEKNANAFYMVIRKVTPPRILARSLPAEAV